MLHLLAVLAEVPPWSADAQVVLARTAVDDVVSSAALEPVVSRSALDPVPGGAARDAVVAGATEEKAESRALRGHEAACLAVHDDHDHVVASTAVEDLAVLGSSRDQGVVAERAEWRFVLINPVAAQDLATAASSPPDRVVARAALDLEQDVRRDSTRVEHGEGVIAPAEGDEDAADLLGLGIRVGRCRGRATD